MILDELIEKYGLEAYFYDCEENPYLMGSGGTEMYHFEYSLYDYDGNELTGYISVGSMVGAPDLYMLLDSLQKDMELYYEGDYESLGFSYEEGERLDEVLAATEEELLSNFGSEFFEDLMSVDFGL